MGVTTNAMTMALFRRATNTVVRIAPFIAKEKNTKEKNISSKT